MPARKAARCGVPRWASKRRLVVIDLVEQDAARAPVDRDVELVAARLLGHRLAGIGLGELQELLERLGSDLELGDDHERALAGARCGHDPSSLIQ